MRLNYECLRKVLLALEEQLDLDENYYPIGLTVPQIASIPTLKNEYKNKEIAYCVYMLADAGFIYFERKKHLISENYNVKSYTVDTVYSITYSGHEFMQKIRDEKVWGKTKMILGKIESMGIEIIAKVASAVIIEMLKSQGGACQFL